MHAGHTRRIVRLSRSHRRRQQAQQASKPAGARSAPTCSFLASAACCHRHSLLTALPAAVPNFLQTCSHPSLKAIAVGCARAQLCTAHKAYGVIILIPCPLCAGRRLMWRWSRPAACATWSMSGASARWPPRARSAWLVASRLLPVSLCGVQHKPHDTQSSPPLIAAETPLSWSACARPLIRGSEDRTLVNHAGASLRATGQAKLFKQVEACPCGSLQAPDYAGSACIQHMCHRLSVLLAAGLPAGQGPHGRSAGGRRGAGRPADRAYCSARRTGGRSSSPGGTWP